MLFRIKVLFVPLSHSCLPCFLLRHPSQDRSRAASRVLRGPFCYHQALLQQGGPRVTLQAWWRQMQGVLRFQPCQVIFHKWRPRGWGTFWREVFVFTWHLGDSEVSEQRRAQASEKCLLHACLLKWLRWTWGRRSLRSCLWTEDKVAGGRTKNRVRCPCHRSPAVLPIWRGRLTTADFLLPKHGQPVGRHERASVGSYCPELGQVRGTAHSLQKWWGLVHFSLIKVLYVEMFGQMELPAHFERAVSSLRNLRQPLPYQVLRGVFCRPC